MYRPQSSKEQTETVITTKTVKALTKEFPYAFIRKIHGGDYQRAGLPDIYISLCGRTVWIEMKRPGADTTALQKKTMIALANTGAFCGTAESPERAIQLIKDVLVF